MMTLPATFFGETFSIGAIHPMRPMHAMPAAHAMRAIHAMLLPRCIKTHATQITKPMIQAVANAEPAILCIPSSQAILAKPKKTAAENWRLSESDI